MAVRPRMKVLKCPGCEVYIRVSGFRILIKFALLCSGPDASSFKGQRVTVEARKSEHARPHVPDSRF